MERSDTTTSPHPGDDSDDGWKEVTTMNDKAVSAARRQLENKCT